MMCMADNFTMELCSQWITELTFNNQGLMPPRAEQ